MFRPGYVMLLALGACDVGSVLARGDGGGGGGGDGSGMSVDDTKCQNALAAPSAPHKHLDDGTPHTGQACMTACHSTGGGGAPMFTMGGTVFTDASGTTGHAGVAVRIKTGATTQVTYSDMAGNFYIEGGPAITFPSNANVTACPSLTPMSGSLVAGAPSGNDCNRCHNKTATAQTPPMNL